MKTEKYIVTIEMPDGDRWSAVDIQDLLQTEADVEDRGRWKVKVMED